MDVQYIFNNFKEDYEKQVRNYIFAFDKALPDGDTNKYYLDKEIHRLKIFNYEETDNHIIIDYNIYTKTSGTGIGNEFWVKPLNVKIPKFHLIMANLKYINDKIAK